MRYIRAVGVLLLVLFAMVVPIMATGPPASTEKTLQSSLEWTTTVTMQEFAWEQLALVEILKEPGGAGCEAIPNYTPRDPIGSRDLVTRTPEHPLLC